ncbi:MAG: hypothetical protein RLP44_13545 [Aggregatilineales bacterium]
MDEFLRNLLDLTNETLAAAIVIIAASMLLYNLSRNLNDRIARASGIVLGCVTVAYVCDVLVSLNPGLGTMESLLRLQWLGVAFIPAATFHLSDALLATTGLPSRGRRRRIVRILYLVAAAFLLLASFTDVLIDPITVNRVISLRAGTLLPIYVLYFLIVNGVALNNVDRARRRCQTRSTKRRMGYLEIALLTPAIGIFPYSVILGPGQEFTLPALIVVNLANFLVIIMLLLLSFPLSFFGSDVPERVVKTQLLRFFLRGPATGLLALVVIIYTDPTSDTLGLPGDMFMPFATVALILTWQWLIDRTLPNVEKRLIYRDEENDSTFKLQQLSERYLSRGDLLRLIDATMEATCDYLRVKTAFVAALNEQTPEVLRSVGTLPFDNDSLTDEMDEMMALFASDTFSAVLSSHQWNGYHLFPLISKRINDSDGSIRKPLIGIMGIEAPQNPRHAEEIDSDVIIRNVYRTSQALDDLILQTEIYAALEGLLPQISITREQAAEVEFLPGRSPTIQKNDNLPDRDQVIEQVHAALRHYWGGPGLTRSRLLQLTLVTNKTETNNDTPVNMLREVLKDAIEVLRPTGERDMRSPEWTLYNILTLRFIEKKKAKETARRLYLAEATLYRKQSAAIAAVADVIINGEHELQAMTNNEPA